MVNLFPIVFFLHLVSGALVNAVSGGGGVSIVGFINFGAFFLALACFIPYIGHDRNFRLSHDYAKALSPALIFTLPSVLLNFDGRASIGYINYFLSLISVYYLAQLYFGKIRDLRLSSLYFLRFFYLFVFVLALYRFLSLGFIFSLNITDVERNDFAFALFEFPHSAVIFICAVLPVYIGLVNLLRKHVVFDLFVIVFCVPFAVLVAGVKVGLLVYVLVFFLSLLLVFSKNKFMIFALVLLSSFALVVVLLSDNYFTGFKDLFSVSIADYTNMSTTSINSLHTRITVWLLMFNWVYDLDGAWFGMGWRAWDFYFWPISGIASSQSDYVTYFFDVGYVGLLGVLVYRFVLVFYLFKYSKTTDLISFFVLVGVVGSIYLSGFTENVDGYPSTSWLLPVLFAWSNCISRQDFNPRCD